ncbi:possible aldehyde dehydrogenase [Salmonella enterica subsp. enterica]|uniref:Possible aldehyde dehydrogenase n=1 Tax=Salmonella enterica I TaxID=59201 RepID=A0A379W315_SALET|nr:possible aldehyde dehydrogenase [Salmonella enterica subsp. enterica]
MGPLANQVQLEKVLRLIQRAREEGIPLFTAVKLYPAKGTFTADGGKSA